MGYFTLVKQRGYIGEYGGVVTFKAVLASNIITEAGQESLISSIKDNVGPDWLYMAAGMGTTTPASADTALVQELCREPIVGKYIPQAGTLTMVSVFGPFVGCGDWSEVGVFDQDVQRVAISSCEGTADWSSDGTLTTNSGTVMEGQLSLRTQMGSTDLVAFELGPTASNPGSNYTWGTADHFQFWYQRNIDIGTVTVRLGANVANYYQWSWYPGASVDTWYQFFDTLGGASEVGTPGTGNFNYFRLSHSAYGTPAYYEFIDYLTMYQDTGTLLARGTVDITKDYNTVMNLFHTQVYSTV